MQVLKDSRVSRKATSEWHAGFIRIAPAISRYARLSFRQLGAEAAADAAQEVLANSLVAYVRLYERGRAHLAFPSVLVRYAVAQFHSGRRVGTRGNSRDVLSPLARCRHEFRVNEFDGDGNPADWNDVLVEDRNWTPADIAAFRIDFADWLNRLSRRKRCIAWLLATGESTNVVARRFRLSAGRISQIRQELEQSWCEYQGETADDEAEQCDA